MPEKTTLWTQQENEENDDEGNEGRETRASMGMFREDFSAGSHGSVWAHPWFFHDASGPYSDGGHTHARKKRIESFVPSDSGGLARNLADINV